MKVQTKEKIKRTLPIGLVRVYNEINKSNSLEYKKECESAQLLLSLRSERKLDGGKFLESFGEIRLRNLTYITGGSGVLDYALLKALAMKFELKNYLEIGTYIGESIFNVSDVCERCIGITADPHSPFAASSFCRTNNTPDFSNRLTGAGNIEIHYCMDSKEYDFSKFDKIPDLVFIDAGHHYLDVKSDTENIWKIKKDNTIIVWHDFVDAYGVVAGVRDALGDEFDNVFVFDNNICGVYLPKPYREYFSESKYFFSEESNKITMYTYNTVLNIERK